ncbi:MAG TPA: S-layer protein, partial [Duganella sp.]|nr:S-layer protein [Duganella sp.]
MPYKKMLLPAAIATMLTVAACGGDNAPQSAVPPLPAGRWIAGDLHTHTTQSADADVSQTLDKILSKAFTSYGLDWMAVSNHLRVSTRDEKGAALAASIPMSLGAER